MVGQKQKTPVKHPALKDSCCTGFSNSEIHRA